MELDADTIVQSYGALPGTDNGLQDFFRDRRCIVMAYTYTPANGRANTHASFSCLVKEVQLLHFTVFINMLNDDREALRLSYAYPGLGKLNQVHGADTGFG